MLDAFVTGLLLVFEWPTIGFLFLGVFIGIWLGAWLGGVSLGGHRPAHTLLIVAGLAYEEFLIEVECVAAAES